jgi:hypothetical protein
MDKLPKAKGEGKVIEENVLAPHELRKLIDAGADPWALPIMFAAFTGARQAEGCYGRASTRRYVGPDCVR